MNTWTRDKGLSLEYLGRQWPKSVGQDRGISLAYFSQRRLTHIERSLLASREGGCVEICAERAESTAVLCRFVLRQQLLGRPSRENILSRPSLPPSKLQV